MTTETPNRSGPFWDGVEGRAPVPRAAATLGFQFIKADVENGTIEVAFEATEDFTNPMGNVLGAFVAAATATAKVIPLSIAKTAV